MSHKTDDAPKHGVSRRSFLKGSAAAASLLPVVTLQGAESDAIPYTIASPRTAIAFNVNGVDHALQVEARWTLAEVLRDELQLTGTKIGCNRSECGACTVLLDGRPVYSCSQLAVWADGARVQTVEGLALDNSLSPLQQSFVTHNAAQCGFCTPGQLMSATALLAANAAPTAAEVRQALSGNLCRCSNYHAIVDAVLAVGTATGGSAGGDA